MSPKNGLFVIVSGPSGVGKTVLVDKLVEGEYVNSIGRLVTTTTRAPREGEVDGVDYHFVTKEQFTVYEQAGAFYETNLYETKDRYGTMRVVLDKLLSVKEVVIGILDINGCYSMLKHMPDILINFIVPDDFSHLQKRIEARPDATSANTEKRLACARKELEHADAFGSPIVNVEGDISLAVIEISQRISRCLHQRA